MSKKKKLLLSIISIVASLAFFEFVLALTWIRYSEPITYEAQNHQGFFLSQFGSPFDDFYDKYTGKKDDWRIVTIGDSFTNGGNVIRPHTYPYFLYEMFDKQYEVKNMGLCEGTTRDSLNRITLNIEESSPELLEKTIYIVLVGASDIFLENEFITDNHHDDFIRNIQTIEMDTSIRTVEDRSGFRILRLFKHAANIIKRNFTENYEFDQYIFEAFQDCHTSTNQTDECLIKVFQNNKEVLSSQEINSQIHAQILYFNEIHSKEPYRDSIRHLLHFMNSNPKNLVYTHLAYNLLSYTLLQNHYTPEDVIAKIKKSYSREREFIDNHPKTTRYNHYSIFFETVENWIENRDELNNNRESILQEMVDKVRRVNAQIVFLTYPLEYTEINNIIRSVSAKNNVPLVDLTPIFQKKRESMDVHLIDDWEHCTPKGYEIMAKNIKYELEKLLEQ